MPEIQSDEKKYVNHFMSEAVTLWCLLSGVTNVT